MCCILSAFEGVEYFTFSVLQIFDPPLFLEFFLSAVRSAASETSPDQEMDGGYAQPTIHQRDEYENPFGEDVYPFMYQMDTDHLRAAFDPMIRKLTRLNHMKCLISDRC